MAELGELIPGESEGVREEVADRHLTLTTICLYDPPVLFTLVQICPLLLAACNMIMTNIYMDDYLIVKNLMAKAKQTERRIIIHHVHRLAMVSQV